MKLRLISISFRLFIFSTITIVLFSCKHSAHVPEPPADAESIRRMQKLGLFLSKFKMLPKRLQQLDFINTDSTLIKIDNPADTGFIGYGAAYGMLADTSRFYALLWYSSDADQAGLKLTTINKTGKKLDEQWLTISFPGDDCGYDWQGAAFLKPDGTIFIRDSTVTYDCDNGIPPESDRNHEIDTMDVKISPSGKIEFSEIRRTVLDKAPEISGGWWQPHNAGNKFIFNANNTFCKGYVGLNKPHITGTYTFHGLNGVLTFNDWQQMDLRYCPGPPDKKYAEGIWIYNEKLKHNSKTYYADSTWFVREQGQCSCSGQ